MSISVAVASATANKAKIAPETTKMFARRIGTTTLRWGIIIGLPTLGGVPFMAYYYYMKYLPMIENQRRERDWRRPIRTTPLFVAGEEGVTQHYRNRATDTESIKKEGGLRAMEKEEANKSTHHASLPNLRDPSDEAAFTALMLEEQRRDEIKRALKEVSLSTKDQEEAITAAASSSGDVDVLNSQASSGSRTSTTSSPSTLEAIKNLFEGSSQAVISSIFPSSTATIESGATTTDSSNTDPDTQQQQQQTSAAELHAEALAVEELKRQIQGTLTDPKTAIGTAVSDPATYVTDTYETLAAAVGMDERKKRSLLAEQAYHNRMAQNKEHTERVTSTVSTINSTRDSILTRVKFQAFVVLRLTTLLVKMVPVAWIFVLCYFGAAPYTFAFDRMKSAFVDMGPTYIKLGQWMATRPDLFPVELCHRLSTLFDSAPSHSWEYTEKVLRGSAGIIHDISEKRRHGAVADDDVIVVPSSILHHIESINTTPVNSGSVAQVYRARLRPGYAVAGCATESSSAASTNPRDVAIKVLHPNVRALIWADILVLKTFARVFSMAMPRGRFLDPLVHWYEFSSLLLSQLNLVREAENLLEFRYNFRDFAGVAFPSPIMELCSPDVLVESFEEGHPLQRTQPSKPLADLGVKMFLKMLFEDNFVHADLHPGNLLVRVKHADGSVGLTRVDHRDKNELVVLDPGLVTSLSPKDRKNFLLLFSAVACGNSDLAANLMLERSPYNACPDVDAFRADMKRIFQVVAPTQGQGAASANSAESMQKNGLRLADVKLGDVLTDILNTMRRHQVSIDGHFATLVMTVVVGEGLGRMMHPNYNLFAAAAPYLVNSLSGSEMDLLVEQLRATYGITELVTTLATA